MSFSRQEAKGGPWKLESHEFFTLKIGLKVVAARAMMHHMPLAFKVWRKLSI